MIPQRGRVLFRNSYLLHSILRPQTTVALSSPISNHIKSWVDAYEEFIGVSAVKDAQSQVMKWEERLSDAQLLRRDKQAELKSIQGRLKEIHFDLDRTSRGEDKYLELLTEEHSTIKRERALLDTFENYESAEREAFHQLSIKVRESHEKERERVEKTKWWGVSASLIGALLGIAGSSIGNTMRMKKIKELLPASQDDLKEVIVSAKDQQEVLRELLIGLSGVMDGKEIKVNNKENLIDGMSSEKVLSLIREENARLMQEISEYTKKMKMERAMDDSEAVVYVGSEMERLLEQTEKKMESKMKLQTLLSVVFLYSALGLTVPVLWALFGR